jgi:excisionase family DNA binding protein
MFMPNEIILNGISFDQLKEEFKTIVQIEVQKIVSGLTTAPEPAPELITRKETALILGISLPTLNDWTKTGIIPAQRIGTRVRYNRANVYASLKDIETLKYRRA